MDSTSLSHAVQHQFDSCAHHYLGTSPMADKGLLDLIVQLARPEPGDTSLDVACGAGFLVSAFARLVERSEGVDLSSVMLREAENHAGSLGLDNASFRQADSASLPFEDRIFDIVTCKLALHYFPDPGRSIKEMKRVLKQDGRIVLIDRVSTENRPQQEYHNLIEKLRTPSKVKVYSPIEIKDLLEAQGLVLESIREYEQHQDVDEWLQSTGAPEVHQCHARELLQRSLNDDLAGLNLISVSGRLQMSHRTVIMVAGGAKQGYS
jgi:ubiquinone/menaquinone biosynthesis C-methylase UbiE